MIELLNNVGRFLRGLAESGQWCWEMFQGLPLWQQIGLGLGAALALAPVLWLIATILFVLPMIRRSLRQHAFSTTVTVLAVALAAGLTMAVFAIQSQTRDAFLGGQLAYDGVLGARGSALQLVMNAVYHLETSPGNLPWKVYQDLKADRNVTVAIPIVLGDNYKGYRLVGTTPEIFETDYQRGSRLQVRPGGRAFDPQRFEAVAGSFAAQQTGLRLGSVFSPYHGLDYNPDEKHTEEYVVVGVMEPTNSPIDRTILIPLEGVYRMEGHVLRGAGEEFDARSVAVIPDEHKEVSAVLVKTRGPTSGMNLSMLVNRQGKAATFAWPIANIMAELFDKIGWVSRVLELVAYLVIVVAAGTIVASVYNTINERRREFAILRSLGARRSTVFSAILLESATIAGIGGLCGYLVYAAILTAATVVIRLNTGVVLDAFAPHWILWTPLGMFVIGGLAGILPAAKAYATDVATNLQPMS